MDKETQATENQEQPKLYGGKYKSVEEMEAALKELESENLQTKEALDREQRLNALLAVDTKPVHTEKPVVQEADLSAYLGEEGAKVLKTTLDSYRSTVMQEAKQEAHRAAMALKEQEKAEKKFYKAYPELEEFTDEVNRQAALVSRELGDRARAIPQEKLFNEVAKRTRDYLADAKKRLVKAPLHLEGGTTTEPKQKTESERPVLDDEAKRTQDYFDNEVREFNKKKTLPLRG